MLILSFFFFMPTIMGCTFISANPIVMQSYSEYDYFIHWTDGCELYTPYLYPGGIVFVNYSVLMNSYTNVSFITFFDDGITWTPTNDNFTLAPGESYSETFTMVLSGYDDIAALSYGASVLMENSNATIRFGYNVINKGTDPLPSNTCVFLFGFIALTSIISILRKKKTKRI